MLYKFIRLFSCIGSKQYAPTVSWQSRFTLTKHFKGYLLRHELWRVFTMNNVTNNDSAWRGVPYREIVGSQIPPEFPLVAPAHNHTVLYHVPSSGCVPLDRPPEPQRGEDKWDSEFVRMPCSMKSLYPVEDSSGETQLKKRWKLIEKALREPIRNSEKLAEAILSYNTQFKNAWKFGTLHRLFNEHLEEEESKYFFDVTLPQIAKLALALPKLIQCPIPLLKQHKNHSISISQQQISSLLANAFFCTFPRRNSTKRTSEYASFPHINFVHLYEANGSDSCLEKLKCLCHYFRRVCTQVPRGAVTVRRRSVAPRNLPQWGRCENKIASVPIHVNSTGQIEHADGLIQMDFANKYLGGGVLGHGCVQEEIRFVICPELMVSMLFTELLRANEAVMIIGCEQYSRYTGYASSFQWSGAFYDETPRDASGRRRTAVLALDALPCRPPGRAPAQFRPPAVLRELNKAWVGFSMYSEASPTGIQYPGVATGNWGCGAFGGTPQLKALIQLMACAVAKRPMAYYTFHDERIRDEIIDVYNVLARYDVSVGELYQIILKFCLTDVRKSHLHTFIKQTLMEKSSKPPEEAHKPESPKQTEKMDISNTSTEEIDLPQPLKKELLKESPDMFAQDEMESPSTIVISSETDSAPTDKKDSEIKMAAADKMADASKMAAMSDLFEEMNKFDQSNGRLNLSQSHSNFLKIDEKPQASEGTPIKENTADPATEGKRRKIMKITDYFSKNTI